MKIRKREFLIDSPSCKEKKHLNNFEPFLEVCPLLGTFPILNSR